MARRRREQKPEPNSGGKSRQETVIGFAWFKEDQWTRFREVCPDDDVLEESYADWRTSALKTIRTLTQQGMVVRKALVDLDELLEWCKSRNLEPNGEARARFAAEKISSQ